MLQIFDPTLLKKKKKKSPFNLDAALGVSETKLNEGGEEKESNDLDLDDLDMDLTTMKKKKKKKTFNLEDIENSLPENDNKVVEGNFSINLIEFARIR